jgi:hypothetical protein
VYLLVFQTYVKEMHGSRSKIRSKISRQAALRGGIKSGVKGLILAHLHPEYGAVPLVKTHHIAPRNV